MNNMQSNYKNENCCEVFLLMVNITDESKNYDEFDSDVYDDGGPELWGIYSSRESCEMRGQQVVENFNKSIEGCGSYRISYYCEARPVLN